MGVVIAGTDKRFTMLKDMLMENGIDAESSLQPEAAPYASVLIAKYPFTDEVRAFADSMKAGSRLILLNACGADRLLTEKFRVNLLSDDLAFVNENAVLTAEGALCAAMHHADFALTGERVMVVGYGRIGRALTEMLVGIRSVVTVVSRREAGRLQAMARGAYASSPESMKPLLGDARVIFVTSPDRMLDKEMLSCIPKSAHIYDLSSAPYGVDHASAKEMELNARLESGIPGRYCPLSAAKCMYRAVWRIWNGGKTV